MLSPIVKALMHYINNETSYLAEVVSNSILQISKDSEDFAFIYVKKTCLVIESYYGLRQDLELSDPESLSEINKILSGMRLTLAVDYNHFGI